MIKKNNYYLAKLSQIIKKVPIIFITVFFLALACLVFKEFVINGLSPFPGDFLQAWYEPWKSLHYKDGTILIPHKPVLEDTFRHLMPFRLLGIELIKKFQLPLWNPYNGSGMPLMATINSGFLDPFNVLFATLSANYAYGIYVIIQFVLIGLTIYFYLCSIKISSKASLLAAVFFVFSGFVTVRLIAITYGLSIALLPFSLYLVEKYKATENKNYLFILPFIITLMIITTQTQLVFYIIGVLTLYVIFRFIADSKEKISNKSFLFYLIMLALGFGLAGLQIIPTYELMHLSNISPDNSFDVIEKFLVPLEHLLTIIIPNYFGNQATYNYWGAKDYIQTVAYIGIFPVFLALISLTKIPKHIAKTRNFFTALTVISIVLALDWPGTKLFYKIPIPLLSTGGPSRIFLLTTFSITVLSAMGFDYFLKVKKIPAFLKKLTILVFFLLFSNLVITFLLSKINPGCSRLGSSESCWQISFRNSALATGIFLIQFLGLSLLLLFRTKRRIAKGGVGLIFIVTILSGIYNDYKYFPTTPNHELFPTIPVIEALREKTTNARVFGFGEANIATNLATQFRIYDPQYYHPLYIHRYKQLIEYANTGKYLSIYPRGDISLRNDYSADKNLMILRERFLDLDSVRYKLYKKQEKTKPPQGNIDWEDNTWLLVSRNNPLPRAYMVNRVIVKKTPSAILQTLFDQEFDIFNTVILEQNISLSNPSDNNIKNVIIDDYQANSVKLTSVSDSDALLILTDNYYPGWHAYVDGKKTPIYRANYTFRAIPISQGKHSVIFRYEPESVKLGKLISIISLIILIVLYNKYKRPINQS